MKDFDQWNVEEVCDLSRFMELDGPLPAEHQRQRRRFQRASVPSPDLGRKPALGSVGGLTDSVSEPCRIDLHGNQCFANPNTRQGDSSLANVLDKTLGKSQHTSRVDVSPNETEVEDQNPPMILNPAEYAIHVFGGVRKLARAIGRSPSSVSKWRREGGAGHIPSAAQRLILEIAKARDLDVTPADMAYGRKGVKRAVKAVIVLVVIALFGDDRFELAEFFLD